MANYVLRNVVDATPMTRGEYVAMRGWNLPPEETASDEGYLTRNLRSGHQTWVPADEFHVQAIDTDSLSFGEALVMAKLGYKISRKGWNGKGMFAYLVPANSYPAVTEAIKGQFQDDLVPYNEYWALKGADQTVSPWAPSGSDTLAEDWMIH